jgi:hypothetical protein
MRTIAIATALAALVVAAVPAASAGDPEAHAALNGYHYCGKIPNPDTGGTTKIYGRRLGCRDSKSLWRIWRRHLGKLTCNEANDFCEVTHVHHFRCVFGGNDFLVRLRCTRGEQRMRGYWGG